MKEINRKKIVGIPFIGVITGDLNLVAPVALALRSSLGDKTEMFPPVSFDQSDYYQNEMGQTLMRTWVFFERLLMQDKLVDFKHESEKVERSFLNEKGGRRINIDPGLLTLNNLILTTHKNSAHRLYLGQGVFAEITLLFQNRQFQPLPWTYPDYQRKAVLDFFGEIRNKNKIRLNTGEG